MSVGSGVGGEIWPIGSALELLGAEAELPVAAGRRRQLLACIGLGMRGTACKIGLESPWAWTNVDPGVAVIAAGGVAGG